MADQNTFLHDTFGAYQREQIQTLFGKKRYLFHLGIWIASAVIYFFMNPDSADVIKIGETAEGLTNKFSIAIRIVSTFIGIVISALFIYSFLLVVIPYSKFRAQKRYILFSIGLQSIIFFVLIIGIIIWKVADPTLPHEILIHSWLSIVYIQFFFIALYFFLEIYDKQKTIKSYSQLLENRIIAETKFLNSQINPHFLFNTLNNIYALSIKDKEKTIIGIETLESLIEYIHKKSHSEFIPLNDEIKFLNSYIELELLRYQKPTPDIHIEVNGEIDKVYIAPLILITFVENAFKHGVKNNKTNPFIHISIEVVENKIVFEILNSVPDKTVPSQHDLDHKIGGIGIQNTIRRLELLYPDNHKLRISHKGRVHSVELSINTENV